MPTSRTLPAGRTDSCPGLYGTGLPYFSFSGQFGAGRAILEFGPNHEIAGEAVGKVDAEAWMQWRQSIIDEATCIRQALCYEDV